MASGELTDDIVAIECSSGYVVPSSSDGEVLSDRTERFGASEISAIESSQTAVMKGDLGFCTALT
jgi:hypothetical protein